MKYTKAELEKFKIKFYFTYDEFFIYLVVENNNNYIKKIKLSNNIIDNLNYENSGILDNMLDDCLKYTRTKKLKALNEI